MLPRFEVTQGGVSPMKDNFIPYMEDHLKKWLRHIQVDYKLSSKHSS